MVMFLLFELGFGSLELKMFTFGSYFITWIHYFLELLIIVSLFPECYSWQYEEGVPSCCERKFTENTWTEQLTEQMKKK